MNIALVGIGKVGSALAKAFARVEDVELLLISRDISNVLPLAEELNAEAATQISSIPSPDLFIICVPDDAISNVSKIIFQEHPQSSQAHVSGSRHWDILSGPKDRLGVFYPLDSFGYHLDDELYDTPILIDGCSDEYINELTDLAYEVSDSIYHLDFDQRQYVHLAAVWLNNFSNALAHKAHGILNKGNAPVDVLDKLTQTTFVKIREMGPKNSQTGPAMREDSKTMDKHLKLMNGADQELYRVLSQLIQNNRKDS